MHPPTIPRSQARFRYTLGAGGLAIFLSFVLLITGVLEMFYYVPTAADAAVSVQRLTYLVPYGGLIRSLHYWAAQALVGISVVHLLRVIFTGAYGKRRHFNYLLGLGLLVLILLLDFSGYILRWDEGIRWALVTGTNLLKTLPLVGEALYIFAVGAAHPGAATVIRFYTWHSFGLTLLMFILSGWHIFRLRRDGGIAILPSQQREKPERIPRLKLVRREVLAMLLTGGALILLSTFFPAPIAPPIADKPIVTAKERAPWFFLWVQQMLKWGNPFLWGVLVPCIFLAVLVLVLYTFPEPAQAELGCWFPPSGRAAQITIGGLALTVLILSFLALIT
jgi:quinol-cytochrome oxidoreductase complex cytochrome b subunit